MPDDHLHVLRPPRLYQVIKLRKSLSRVKVAMRSGRTVSGSAITPALQIRCTYSLLHECDEIIAVFILL